MSIEHWIAKCDKLETDLWGLREEVSILNKNNAHLMSISKYVDVDLAKRVDMLTIENKSLKKKQDVADEIFSKIYEYYGDSL